MKDTNNLSEFGSFTRIRQIAVTMLFALTLSTPLVSMAATPQLTSFDLSKTTIVRNWIDSITATVTISCPSGYDGYEWGPSLTSANGFVLMPSGVVVYCGDAPTSTSAPFSIYPDVMGGTSPQTDTITATVPQGNSISKTITLVPLSPTLTISPGTLRDGSGQTVTATVNTGVQVYDGAGSYTISTNSGALYGPSSVRIPDGNSSVQFQLSLGTAVSTDTPVTVTATQGYPIYGANSASATVMVRPAGAGAVSPANNGHPRCIVGCGPDPINATTGNVWIDQRDYSVPGLGGGLELSRTWNSQWSYSSPPTLAGMFGLGWQSTYEEQLYAANGQTLLYWRGDGSGWTFTYNSVLNSYSLTSPPDVRAQLVSNLTGGFTLTLPDGTQRVFNGQNLLAALIDRNHNQTTLAYDTYNRLASVTSPGGSTLTFTYGGPNNPSQATTAQDSVGTVATYTYDSTSRLTKVSYPDGSALNFTYDPNSSMILSVTDSQGKLLESHTYDAQNRGLTSARAYGVDSVSLSY
jgi:YD repeat-containing protein